jgi:hypothetical protein
VIASGDRGVVSTSSTTWLSWTCPPVHREIERPTFAIDNRMDFRGSTASADANRLIFRRAVNFYDGAVDQIQTIV